MSAEHAEHRGKTPRGQLERYKCSETAASVKPGGQRAHAVAFSASLAYGAVLNEGRLAHGYDVNHTHFERFFFF